LQFSENLPMRGTYTLVILLEKETRIKVQKLGCFILQKGYYAYTGSALGDGAVNLRNRVARHLKKRKAKHWHIDFLVAHKNAVIAAIVVAESNVNRECQVNDAIKDIDGATVPIVGFGASDCKQNCGSHLVFFGDENVTERIIDRYRDLFGVRATFITLEGRHIKCM
jgi:Uri superfamily endonuclease